VVWTPEKAELKKKKKEVLTGKLKPNRSKKRP
jgi:hypothetical protein